MTIVAAVADVDLTPDGMLLVGPGNFGNRACFFLFVVCLFLKVAQVTLARKAMSTRQRRKAVRSSLAAALATKALRRRSRTSRPRTSLRD